MLYEVGDIFIIKEDGITYEGMIVSNHGPMYEFSWKYHDKTSGFKYHRNSVTETQITDNYLKGKINE